MSNPTPSPRREAGDATEQGPSSAEVATDHDWIAAMRDNLVRLYWEAPKSCPRWRISAAMGFLDRIETQLQAARNLYAGEAEMRFRERGSTRESEEEIATILGHVKVYGTSVLSAFLGNDDKEVPDYWLKWLDLRLHQWHAASTEALVSRLAATAEADVRAALEELVDAEFGVEATFSDDHTKHGRIKASAKRDAARAALLALFARQAQQLGEATRERDEALDASELMRAAVQGAEEDVGYARAAAFDDENEVRRSRELFDRCCRVMWGPLPDHHEGDLPDHIGMLKSDVLAARAARGHLEDEIVAAQALRLQMEEALKFYADPNTWQQAVFIDGDGEQQEGGSLIQSDAGKRAHAFFPTPIAEAPDADA